MGWMSTISAKLSAMNAYCVSQASSCGVDQANTISRYNAQFSALSAAINNYITDEAAIEGRSEQLKNIIMFDFTRVMLENITYTPSIIVPTETIEEPFPAGYTDYWELFGCAGLGPLILSRADSYYWEGCIISPSGTTPKLQADIAAASSGEATDVANRNTLISFLQSFPSQNTMIFLTEDMSIGGSPRTKQATAAIIYGTKGAEEIITSMGLTTYIPSYI